MGLSDVLSAGTLLPLLGIALAWIIFRELRKRGLFYEIAVSIGKPPLKEATVVYKFATGPYKNANKLFQEVCTLATNDTHIGIYYDDPKKVPAENLRYAVGTVLSEGPKQAVDEALKKKMLAAGFRLFHVPLCDSVVNVRFPWVKDTINLLIAVWRVYPKMAAYIHEKKVEAHPFLEIYKGDFIYFMAPLMNQEAFYVPEAQNHK